MSPTATAARPAKKAAPAPASVPGYAGKLLRVNLSTGKIWTPPWAQDMREYLGGVGRKITGITKRKFKANVQKVRAVIDGKVCRVRVSAKAIHMGLVEKPVKRSWKPAAD